MQPNAYSIIFAALIIAIFFTRDRIRWTWRLFAVCQIFSATSVAELTALGGSTFAVSHAGVAALVFTAFLVIAPRDLETTRVSLRVHMFGLMIIFYTLLITAVGPRLFADQINLVAMRPDVLDGVTVALPLGPRSSNFTHATYLCASFLTALATTMVFRSKLTAEDFRTAILATGALHAAFGLIDAVGSAAGLGRVLDFLRNANYMMLDQTVTGVIRLSGQLSEASSYAAVAAPFAVFATEEWLGRRKPLAGLVALACWLMLLASTSTTGLVSFAVYMAILLPRLALSSAGRGINMTPLLIVAGAGLGFAAFALFAPLAFSDTVNFVTMLTFGKVDSQSAIERGSWAAQGWNAFKTSWGIGIGVGTFRSSSWVMAVLGSLGAPGAALILIYLGQIANAALGSPMKIDQTRKSAAWAALMTLVGAAASSPTPDPGCIFGLFAGFALCPFPASSPALTERSRPFERSAAQAS